MEIERKEKGKCKENGKGKEGRVKRRETRMG